MSNNLGDILKTLVINVLLGITVFIIGFLVIVFLSDSDGKVELSYYAAIAYALLYLASVISVCTAIIVKKLGNSTNGER
ncbi:hypothetical protein [Paenibacillus gansuensis]|uniref:Uncharacterized protein n=1 Tax=Paenibacillus gansuensis TaxID=306542 RepID=A0ABW5P9H6_9BACL